MFLDFCPVENFSACGGHLQGTWELQAHCPEAHEEAPCEFPFDKETACRGPENTVHCQLNIKGSLTFGDKAVRVQRTEFIKSRYTFSESCTAAVKPEAGPAVERCTALSRTPIMTCALEKEICVCDARIEGEPVDQTVPYSVQKSSLRFDEFEASYCVEKDSLVLSFEPHPLSWKYWVLTRAALGQPVSLL